MSRVLAIVLGLCSIAHAQKQLSDFFPMEKGTRWTYSGKVEWTKQNSNIVVSETKSITMVVEDAFQNDDVRVAILSGGPWNFAFWDPESKLVTYALIQQKDTYYLVSSPSDELLTALKRGDWPTEPNVEAQIWFKVPLHRGDEFCGPDDQERIARHDTDYCWFVQRTGKAVVPGLHTSRTMNWYDLRFQTNPDHEIDTLVPGIGITHFVYMHHGTVSNVDVRLTAFKRGKQAVRPKRNNPLGTRR